MKTVHVILQGKGGVGKSLVSSILCQYFMERFGKKKLIAIDTDPINQTLAQYKTLDAFCLDLKDGIGIDSRKIDELTDIVMSADDDTHIVVDNGSATFVPFSAWMIENDTLSIWQKNNVDMLIHSVVTGGQALYDCVSGINDLANNIIAEKKIVVWLNSYFGEIALDGKCFTDFKVYNNNIDKIASIIKIPYRNPQTFGVDLSNLFSRHQTFAEAADDDDLGIMVKNRLSLWWRDMCAELDLNLREPSSSSFGGAATARESSSVYSSSTTNGKESPRAKAARSPA